MLFNPLMLEDKACPNSSSKFCGVDAHFVITLNLFSSKIQWTYQIWFVPVVPDAIHSSSKEWEESKSDGTKDPRISN